MKMVLYQPRFRHPEKAAKPPNLADAEGIAPGLNPVFADPADLAVDVETPSGEVLAVDDPILIQRLEEGLGDRWMRGPENIRPEAPLIRSIPGSSLSRRLVLDRDKETGRQSVIDRSERNRLRACL